MLLRMLYNLLEVSAVLSTTDCLAHIVHVEVLLLEAMVTTCLTVHAFAGLMLFVASCAIFTTTAAGSGCCIRDTTAATLALLSLL